MALCSSWTSQRGTPIHATHSRFIGRYGVRHHVAGVAIQAPPPEGTVRLGLPSALVASTFDFSEQPLKLAVTLRVCSMREFN
jgi:hypothetical protein